MGLKEGRTRRDGEAGPQVVLFCFVFFASGFAALTYQVVWQRLLAFCVGTDVYSVTIIVAAFMAGLGFGSLAGGHLADSLGARRCLIAFGLSELAVGGFALVSVPLYYHALYLRSAWIARSPFVMAVVLFGTLLWPTFFMGVSLPLLSKALTAQGSGAAHHIGSLYGYNTLGAAVGSLAALCILARFFGLVSVIHIAAAINFGCALVALGVAMAYRGGAKERGGDAAGPRDTSPRPALFGLQVWSIVYFLSGYVALSLEIIWFRILSVMLKCNSFTFGILLAIFLAGVSLGSLAARRRAPSVNPACAFFALQAGIPLYAAASLAVLVSSLGGLPVLDPLYSFLGGPDQFELGDAVVAVGDMLSGRVRGPQAPSLVGLFASLYVVLPVYLVGPPTVMMGMSFAILQDAVQTDGRRLGRRLGWLQASNIMGSTCGAALTGLVLLRWLGSSGTIAALLVFSALFGAVVGRACLGRTSWAALCLSAATPAAVAAFVPGATALWAKAHGVPPRLVIVGEDPSGVSVLRRRGHRTEVCVNGVSISGLPYGGVHTILGALPVLLHPFPQRVAVIGLGSGDTLFATGGRPETRSIECVEIVAPQVRTLGILNARRPYPGLAALLVDPRIRFTEGDGRRFLMETRGLFDVIEADALRPHNAYSGNLYSREYFELLLGKLSPGGLAVTWAPTPRTHDTFLSVFPHALSFGAEGFEVLVGSASPIAFDPQSVAARLREPSVRDYYARGGVDIAQTLFPVLSRPLLLQGSGGPGSADINTDLFPKDEYFVPQSATANGAERTLRTP